MNENDRVIWNGELAEKYSLDLVGGKGSNLLRLHKYSADSELFIVPKFFIIPTDVRSWSDGLSTVYNSSFVEEAFEKLEKPVVVRSSSPLEDGVNASFAGQFLTLHDVLDYSGLCQAISQVKDSALRRSVEKYAESMGVKMEYHMPVIVQEQVPKNSTRIIMQLENDGATQETFFSDGDSENREYEWRDLDKFFGEDAVEEKLKRGSLFDLPHIGEGQYYYALQVARRARRVLGLEGTVQVEAFLNGRSLPYFVQIRQLPKVKNLSSSLACAGLDISVPEGVPFIESTVCNGVPGDISLPAYVTFSQAGFNGLLIETGQASLIGLTDREPDERADRFYRESKLAKNAEFDVFFNLAQMRRVMGLRRYHERHDPIWANGNNLFSEYVLVCDKLDESIVGMATLTTNKKAIITCNEATKTSHAMTVARELGIPAMGIHGNFSTLEPKFYHEVESGDIIRMKSNGKRAVAYIEKKRDKDPYKNS